MAKDSRQKAGSKTRKAETSHWGEQAAEPGEHRPIMDAISPASEADLVKSSECFALAFDADPLMRFFFPGENRATFIRQMFDIMLRVRLTLGMPVLVRRQEGRIVGSVMGYDVGRPEWPAPLREEWSRFEDRQPAMVDRFARYETVAGQFEPAAPHYYLGALCVAPSMHRRGVGSSLVDAYCRASAEDPASSGTYLETGRADLLSFYRDCGFELVGDGDLDGETKLWCLFRAAR